MPGAQYLRARHSLKVAGLARVLNDVEQIQQNNYRNRNTEKPEKYAAHFTLHEMEKQREWRLACSKRVRRTLSAESVRYDSRAQR